MAPICGLCRGTGSDAFATCAAKAILNGSDVQTAYLALERARAGFEEETQIAQVR